MRRTSPRRPTGHPAGARWRSAGRPGPRRRLSPRVPSVATAGEVVMDLVEALDRLPKVELHCHVEGTMRPQTVAELAAKNGRGLPVDDPEDLYRYGSLDDFLSVFWLVQESLVDPDDWSRLAYESV